MDTPTDTWMPEGWAKAPPTKDYCDYLCPEWPHKHTPGPDTSAVATLVRAARNTWLSFGVRSDVRHSGQVVLGELFEALHAIDPTVFQEPGYHEWAEAVFGRQRLSVALLEAVEAQQAEYLNGPFGGAHPVSETVLGRARAYREALKE